MLRRRTALLALAAVVLSGCATFENNDVVARVGDVELGNAEFERRAAALDRVVDGRVAGDLARDTISNWIALQLADRADVVDAYLQGPETSGITCFAFVPAPDVPTADRWKDDLDAGGSLDELVAAEAPDFVGNNQACVPVNQLGGDPAQVEGMSPSDPNRVFVRSEGIVLVLQMQGIDEIGGLGLLQAAAAVEIGLADAIVADAATADIEVAPRFGTYDPQRLFVIPLG